MPNALIFRNTLLRSRQVLPAVLDMLPCFRERAENQIAIEACRVPRACIRSAGSIAAGTAAAAPRSRKFLVRGDRSPGPDHHRSITFLSSRTCGPGVGSVRTVTAPGSHSFDLRPFAGRPAMKWSARSGISSCVRSGGTKIGITFSRSTVFAERPREFAWRSLFVAASRALDLDPVGPPPAPSLF